MLILSVRTYAEDALKYKPDDLKGDFAVTTLPITDTGSNQAEKTLVIINVRTKVKFSECHLFWAMENDFAAAEKIADITTTADDWDDHRYTDFPPVTGGHYYWIIVGDGKSFTKPIQAAEAPVKTTQVSTSKRVRKLSEPITTNEATTQPKRIVNYKLWLFNAVRACLGTIFGEEKN